MTGVVGVQSFVGFVLLLAALMSLCHQTPYSPIARPIRSKRTILGWFRTRKRRRNVIRDTWSQDNGVLLLAQEAPVLPEEAEETGSGEFGLKVHFDPLFF